MGIINKHANLYNRRGDLMIAVGCYPKDQMGNFIPETVGRLFHKTNKRKKP